MKPLELILVSKASTSSRLEDDLDSFSHRSSGESSDASDYTDVSGAYVLDIFRKHASIQEGFD